MKGNMARDKKIRAPREVINIISSEDTFKMIGVLGGGHIEVRQKRDGSFSIFYPDEGFISCPPVCDLKHKHDYERGWTESSVVPKNKEDAMTWAQMLAEDREVKFIPYTPLHKRRKKD